MNIEFFHPRAADLVGFIPEFLWEHDQRPAKEQFNERYAHGGGWQPFEGFWVGSEDKSLNYPEDPPILPVAKIKFRQETIYVYPHAWVMIVQADGSHEIARMD
jgi:hypothetical protein